MTLGWQVPTIGTCVFRGRGWRKVDAYPTSEPVAVRDYISRLMPLTGQAAVRWQPMGQPFWLEAVVDAAEKATRLSADDKRDGQRIPPGGTPGYAVLTLRGGMTVRDDLRLTVALENVADEDYRIHGSGVNEPGRNLVVQAEWTFWASERSRGQRAGGGRLAFMACFFAFEGKPGWPGRWRGGVGQGFQGGAGG